MSASKKVLLIFGLTILFTLIIFLVYFQPKFIRQIRLKSDYSHLSVLSNLMAQIRVAHIDYTKLDSKSSSFYSSKTTLLDKLVETNSEAQSIAKNIPPTLYEDVNLKVTLEDQSNLYKEVYNFHTTFQNLYEYDPYVDLYAQDIFQEKQDLIERLEKAKLGLRALQVPEDMPEIRTQIDAIASQIPAIQQALESESQTSFAFMDRFASDILSLRESVVTRELDILRTHKGVQTLTAFTNELIKVNNQKTKVLRELNSFL